jgi:hypothetical protein
MFKRSRIWGLCLAQILGAAGAVWGSWSTPVPVTEVNTPYYETNPFLSNDGLSLYFTRENTDQFYFARMYQATRPTPSGPFTQVKEISTLNASGSHIYSPWVSPDNLRMYYMRTESGNQWRLKFTQRASVNDPWLPGVNIAELNVLGRIDRLTLSADERTIVFGDDGTIANGRGSWDLWTATRSDRNSAFGQIRNLSEINTAAAEAGPCLSPDGLTLYFHSNPGGVKTIYEASRLTLGDSFGSPQALSIFDVPGPDGAYPAMSADGRTLYFRLYEPSRSSDIYVSYLIPEPVTCLFLAGGFGLLARCRR